MRSRFFSAMLAILRSNRKRSNTSNKAETKTILPVIEAFAAAHRLPEVTVVADAGMLSEANLAAIEDAGCGAENSTAGAGGAGFRWR